MHRQFVIQISITYYQLGFSFLIVFHGTKSPSEYQFIVTIIKLVNMMEEQLLIFRQINIQKLWIGSIYLSTRIWFATKQLKRNGRSYYIQEEGRFFTQLDSNITNAGACYLPPGCYNNNLSSSLESTDTTETDYTPAMKSKQLDSILMRTLNTQQNRSIATQAHFSSEPKTSKSHNITPMCNGSQNVSMRELSETLPN